MRKSKVIESVKSALKEKKLPERFKSNDFRNACPGFAYTTYHVFLPKHRIGNPGGYTEYFQQYSDGSYSLLPQHR
jgi:hypothetical protein